MQILGNTEVLMAFRLIMLFFQIKNTLSKFTEKNLLSNALSLRLFEDSFLVF